MMHQLKIKDFVDIFTIAKVPYEDGLGKVKKTKTDKEFYYQITQLLLQCYVYLDFKLNVHNEVYSQLKRELQEDINTKRFSAMNVVDIDTSIEKVVKTLLIDLDRESNYETLKTHVECRIKFQLIEKYVSEMKKIPRLGMAYNEVLTKGYLSTESDISLSDIARMSGYGPSTFYKYVKNGINELAGILWVEEDNPYELFKKYEKEICEKSRML